MPEKMTLLEKAIDRLRKDHRAWQILRPGDGEA
jgi:hypothetical protein